MKIIDMIDNSLIICPNSYKKSILEELFKNKKILNVKFMTKEEYLKNYFFDYDENTLLYLIRKGIKVENALILLRNLYYIDDSIDNEKIKYLSSLKKELDSNNLLIYNSLFSKELERYSPLIYGYGKINSFEKKIYGNYKVIDYEKTNDKFLIYHFKTIEEEMEYLFNEIALLLSKGIDINKIHLLNVTSEYLPYLKRFSNLYSININISSDDSILGTVVIKEFLEMINNNLSKEEITVNLSKYSDDELWDILINIMNKYDDLKEAYEIIYYDLINIKINKKYQNVVKINSVFDYIPYDDYVFLIGFNNDSIPIIKNNEDYLDDDLCHLLKIPDTLEENKLSKENTLNYLKSFKNIQISYKDSSPFNTYYPSILLDDMNYEEIKYDFNYNYSDEYNRVKYTYLLDDYLKYGNYNNNLEVLYKCYDKNNYLNYDNSFKGLDNEDLLKYLNYKLTLSYSSVDNYYKCGFKYYLSNILKIDLYEETWQTIIGNIFHSILSKINDKDFNFDKEWNSFIESRIWSNKEEFFLDKLKNELLKVIEIIQKQEFMSGLNYYLHEEKIVLPIRKYPLVEFKGFIDKIMYREKDGETLVSIIDYKTGNTDINLDNIKYGLSLQLPVYLYLLARSNIFSNIKFVGFYLQHILNSEIKFDERKSFEDIQNDNLKLMGYSTNNKNRLSIFDPTMEKSEMIKGIKLRKDGEFSSTSKCLDDLEFESIINLVDEKVKKASDEILSGKFLINPKIINSRNVSCDFCSFKDICYKKEKNNIYLKEEDDVNA